jgi:hypothetical protein
MKCGFCSARDEFIRGAEEYRLKSCEIDECKRDISELDISKRIRYEIAIWTA